MIPSGAIFGGKHTYRDFGMLPKSKIVFAPPEPKTEMVDIVGGDGVLDYTEALTGKVAYANRRGSLEFVVITPEMYLTTFSTVLAHFHGKKMRVVLDDDPLYFYMGRFTVNRWKSDEGFSTIVIDYDLEPYKYPVSSTAMYDWLWNDLFDNTIYYGTFAVSGTKARTFINPSATSVTPTITCSDPMTCYFNSAPNTVYRLDRGKNEAPGFNFASGDNVMTFTGSGTVLVDYVLGAEL